MRVFLSYPMNGIDQKKQEEMRTYLLYTLKSMYPNKYFEVVDNSDCEGDEDDGRLHYLGEAIKKMDRCDAIIFHPMSDMAKGCEVERKVAELYGLKIIDTNEAGLRLKDLLGNDRTGTQTYNTLARAGIGSVSALMQMTTKELKAIKKLGNVGVDRALAVQRAVGNNVY